MTTLAFILTLLSALDAPSRDCFKITVIDGETRRGVPLVELKTVNSIRCVTDSNGIVAFHEPGLMDQDVFFFVTSHGYEFPKDGFGMAGRSLRTTPGGSAELEIKRINVAQRLYRVTGQGIYHDSVLCGEPVPIEQPVLNGRVVGQDSIQSAVYQGKLWWFWGDTGWPKYPLGNFHMSGATSPLPGQGALDPDVGVNLTYFVRDDGFAKEMAPRPEPGPVWCDAFVTLPDEAGRERMYNAYARVTTTMESVERGWMLYDDDKRIFEKVKEFDVNAPVRPGGHPFTHAEDGVDYLWFPAPFPLVRVRADARSYLDLDQYEAWTPLVEGGGMDAPEIDRDASGRVRYAWRRHTPALDQKQQDELIKAGKLKPEETWIRLQDADTGKPVLGHAGSVYWNEYRHRWITIRCEVFGTSMLGETWYAEADTPLGPWAYARKIVTHDKYSFYNPKQHPVYDKDGGRIIYFEGTYTYTFSGREDPTPRYDYNQIMYKLDLADERLALPVPVYRVTVQNDGERLRTGRPAADAAWASGIAFFAPDRPAVGTVPVYERLDRGPGWVLSLDAPPASNEQSTPLFHAFPADMESPPATTVLLYLWKNKSGDVTRYAQEESPPGEGYGRSENPLCRVWRNPWWTATDARDSR